MIHNKDLIVLEKKGFVKTKIEKKYIKQLEIFRNRLKIRSKKILKNKKFNLEDFHKYQINDIKLNNFRLSLIEYIKSYKNLNNIVYASLKNIIDECVGPDVLVQKTSNLVIQKPNDINRSPFHKDAPVASNYEIVIWLPLVNCRKTMSMYIFDIKHHDKTKRFLKNVKSERKIINFCKKYGRLYNYKFGEALIFWTNNYHYIPVNGENNTRWSLNLRFKNLFTPYGTKNLLDYYKILRVSPLTQLLNKIDEI